VNVESQLKVCRILGLQQLVVHILFLSRVIHYVVLKNFSDLFLLNAAHYLQPTIHKNRQINLVALHQGFFKFPILEMPTANYDASRVTQRKRAVALYSGYAANNTAVAAGQSVRREQPDTQLAEIVAYRNTTKAYTTPSSGTAGGDVCACSAEIGVNGLRQ